MRLDVCRGRFHYMADGGDREASGLGMGGGGSAWLLAWFASLVEVPPSFALPSAEGEAAGACFGGGGSGEPGVDGGAGLEMEKLPDVPERGELRGEPALTEAATARLGGDGEEGGVPFEELESAGGRGLAGGVLPGAGDD